MKQLLTLALILCSFCSGATHIVGGGFSIRWVGGDDYEITLKVFRDCLNGEAAFNDILFIGVFSKSNDLLQDTFGLSLGEQDTPNFAGSNCPKIFTGELGCTEIGTYRRIIRLPAAMYNEPAGYYVSWERCCRNNIIRNIANPGKAGMTFYMEIPAPAVLRNSSPVFSGNPVTGLCVNNPFNYNLNFTDADGDSLVYWLTDPLRGNLDDMNPNDNPNNPQIFSGPYDITRWRPPFSRDDAFGSSQNPLKINRRTGELSGQPSQTGIFVSSVLVEEYRNGVKIGEVRVELQFTVTVCSGNSFPSIAVMDEQGNNVTDVDLTIAIPQKKCYTVIVQDATDSVYASVNGDMLTPGTPNQPDITISRFSAQQVKVTFCWQTNCDFTFMPPQTFTVSGKDNGCPVAKTTNYQVKFRFDPMPVVSPVDLLCMDLSNNQELILYWGDSVPVDPYFGQYVLYRNNGDLTPFVRLDSINNKLTRQYHDLNTPDYHIKNYQYVMVGMNECGQPGPASDTLGTFEQIKEIPDQQQLYTVTVVDNKSLQIIWPVTKEKDFAQYFLYKGTRKDTLPRYKMIDHFTKPTDTSYTDHDVDVQHTSYCYYVIMKDTCGNIGPIGKRFCSIVLSGKTKPFEDEVKWDPFVMDDYSLNYQLYHSEDEKEPYVLTSLTKDNITYTNSQLNTEYGKSTYTVEALYVCPEIGPDLLSARSNSIDLVQAPVLYIPNAFTVNHDGLNDTWNIRDVFVKNYLLRIYNKWGQMVFETRDKNHQWDGRSSDGSIMQSDVYLYIVTYSGWEQSEHTLKGTVTILR